MPAKTPKQYRFMQAAAHGRTTGGPSEALAKEFISGTPPKKRKEFTKKKHHSSHNSHGY